MPPSRFSPPFYLCDVAAAAAAAAVVAANTRLFEAQYVLQRVNVHPSYILAGDRELSCVKMMMREKVTPRVTTRPPTTAAAKAT